MGKSYLNTILTLTRNMGNKKEYAKKYYQEHRQENIKYAKKYRQEHKQEIKEWNRKYYKDHQEERAKYQRRYRKAYPEKKRERDHKWDKAHPEKIRKSKRKFHKAHPERVLEWNRKCNERRRRTDPRFRLDKNIGNVIGQCLKGRKAGIHWEILVGYTIEDLKKYLEKQFDEKMSWENYGLYWDVDHIKPISLFRYTLPEDPEFKQCWALENLQPLEHMTNVRKSNHYQELTLFS